MSNKEFFRSYDYGDLILHEHWRLQNIKIEHTHGEKIQQRGWGSVLRPDGEYDLVSETIDSSKTPFEPLILLVPPELLGTHEATDPDHIPVEGEEKRGFEGIDLSNGWDGSPLAAACFAVCKGDEIIKSDIYPSIYRTLLSHGGIGILDDLVYGDLGVLDGHHRRRLAAEDQPRLKYVPVQIIPYLYDPSVILRTWHYDGKVWKAEQVFECFKIPDKFADAKRTKFGITGRDGITRRILDAQPDIHIPLEDLR